MQGCTFGTEHAMLLLLQDWAEATYVPPRSPAGTIVNVICWHFSAAHFRDERPSIALPQWF